MINIQILYITTPPLTTTIRTSTIPQPTPTTSTTTTVTTPPTPSTTTTTTTTGPLSYKYTDPDGRPIGRTIFKSEAPTTIGQGKWSVAYRGYKPK